MIGKLMKYELRSMLRTFLPMWGILLIVALMNRFTLQVEALQDWLNGVPTIILMFVYVMGIMAIAIVAVIFIVQRFYNGLLKDEGYLMFTLPVTSGQLIWAKCLTASILLICTTLVCVLSIGVMVVSNDVILEMRDGFREALLYAPEEAKQLMEMMVPMTVMGVVVGCVGMIVTTMQAYLAMAIGQLANKHRVGFSILAYIGINIALSSIGTSLMATNLPNWVDQLDTAKLDTMSVSGVIWIMMGITLVLELIQLVIFYFPTNWILKNKLNLE